METDATATVEAMPVAATIAADSIVRATEIVAMTVALAGHHKAPLLTDAGPITCGPAGQATGGQISAEGPVRDEVRATLLVEARAVRAALPALRTAGPVMEGQATEDQGMGIRAAVVLMGTLAQARNSDTAAVPVVLVVGRKKLSACFTNCARKSRD